MINKHACYLFIYQLFPICIFGIPYLSISICLSVYLSIYLSVYLRHAFFTQQFQYPFIKWRTGIDTRYVVRYVRRQRSFAPLLGFHLFILSAVRLSPLAVGWALSGGLRVSLVLFCFMRGGMGCPRQIDRWWQYVCVCMHIYVGMYV